MCSAQRLWTCATSGCVRLRLGRTLLKASDDQRHVLGTILASLKQADYGKINASLQGSVLTTGTTNLNTTVQGAIAQS